MNKLAIKKIAGENQYLAKQIGPENAEKSSRYAKCWLFMCVGCGHFERNKFSRPNESK